MSKEPAERTADGDERLPAESRGRAAADGTDPLDGPAMRGLAAAGIERHAEVLGLDAVAARVDRWFAAGGRVDAAEPAPASRLAYAAAAALLGTLVQAGTVASRLADLPPVAAGLLVPAVAYLLGFAVVAVDAGARFRWPSIDGAPDALDGVVLLVVGYGLVRVVPVGVFGIGAVLLTVLGTLAVPLGVLLAVPAWLASRFTDGPPATLAIRTAGLVVLVAVWASLLGAVLGAGTDLVVEALPIPLRTAPVLFLAGVFLAVVGALAAVARATA